MRRTSSAMACVVLAAIAIASCGHDEAIVGGACKAGLSVCGSECLDLVRDAKNCGSCGHACPDRAACHGGICQEAADAALSDAEAGASIADGSPGVDADASQSLPESGTIGPQDGASEADAVSDAETTDADATVPPDDATTDATTSETGADACSPPYDTSEHCGSCAKACSGATPQCTSSDAGFTCTPACTAPLLDCGGVCVDVTGDPFNCGACNVVCPSQLCRTSVCVGGTPGSLVYIGNDYAKPPSSAPQARVLSNAVFASGGTSFEVLAYERYADPNATAGAAAILSAAAARAGRTLHLTVTNSDADIPAKLSIGQYDTLLVFDQSGAPASALRALGGAWAATLATFTQSGGVVVVLDGGSGAGEMPAFATGTGLLNVSAHAAVTAGSELDVLISSDVVGVQVITPYGAGAHTVTIATERASGSVVYVVAPASDAGVVTPVVVHKVL